MGNRIERPSPVLRFVERKFPGRKATDPPTTRFILQQWWEFVPTGVGPCPPGEWRDVPLEVEK